MGFWGSFVLAKTATAFAELSTVEQWELEVEGTSVMGDGWTVTQINGTTLAENSDEVLTALEGESGNPVLTGFVMDSDAVIVEARTPEGFLRLCLPRVYAVHEMPESLEMFELAATAVPKLAAWAAAAGTLHDDDALRSLIDDDADSQEAFQGYAAFFALVSALGFAELPE